MFDFTCNESKINESFTFWNNLQEKNELFHNILIYWDAPVCALIYYTFIIFLLNLLVMSSLFNVCLNRFFMKI